MPDANSGISAGDIFSDEQVAQLSDNLDPRNVKTLTSGSKASYIEGWHAIAEANRIFGFGNWDRETIRCEETNRDLVEVKKQRNNEWGVEQQWRVGYLYSVRITVRTPNGEVRRDGTGFGSGYGKVEALGDCIESAAKEAETDAMKRALMTFGNPFGLALYDKSKARVGPSMLDDDDEDAGPSDAGSRETPKTQQTAGAGSPPVSAPAKPVTTMSKANARDDFKAMVEEIRATQSKPELAAWMRDNAKRVGLQPEDWRPEIRKECEAMLAGFAAIAAEQEQQHGNAR